VERVLQTRTADDLWIQPLFGDRKVEPQQRPPGYAQTTNDDWPPLPALLFERHPAHEVAGTFVGRQTPVLVRCEVAVAARVLETIVTDSQYD
jgi:hypothetical protein